MTAKALQRQLIAAIAMLLVAAIALGSSTYAWFVNNNKVTASMATVQAATAGSNLLIKAAYTAASEQTGGSTTAPVALASTTLSPVSTNAVTDTAKWYEASTWVTNNANASGEQLASAYQALTLTNTAPNAGDQSANATFVSADGTTRTAYQVAQYTLYTTGTSADVYLAPTDGLKVDNGGTSGAFYNAMRVGVVVDGTLVLVYAPAAEAAVDPTAGNDTSLVTASTTAAGYHYVTGANTVTAAASNWTNDLATYSAAAGQNGSYSVTNQTKIASAVGKAGKKVDIYVWLEGTDYQCVTSLAGADTTKYTVTANFVGVATSYTVSFTTQPASTSTVNTALTVVATQTPAGTVTYQWYNGSGAITNATGASYTPTVAGSYYCIATGTGGATATSNTAVVS